ncbi:hypothetical protein [Streptomyces sp. WAC08401]|uniref:hypothetical protein n=1 Tax=Streptomyces sp. WAC08401 TaxID=2487413 RepID=UPI000F9E0E95|nr:hypothetical protein [Streptomyces sp. WAC08401]RSS11401.1 hypothetical protein EF915_24950 [Streptomyces sp. WAC08401]
MPQYVVTYDTGESQRIDAARVDYGPEDCVFTFYGEDGKGVAWVSISETRSVVLASALNSARATQVIR